MDIPLYRHNFRGQTGKMRAFLSRSYGQPALWTIFWGNGGVHNNDALLYQVLHDIWDTEKTKLKTRMSPTEKHGKPGLRQTATSHIPKSHLVAPLATKAGKSPCLAAATRTVSTPAAVPRETHNPLKITCPQFFA